MSSEPGTKSDLAEMAVELKNPALAAFLAWLVPGLGHFYQGRWAKGLLFSVSILGTFLLGLFLGTNAEVGPARVVYFARDPFRPHYLCQVWAGAVSLPAIFQYRQAQAGKTEKESPLGRFMWPPSERRGEADQLHLSLHRFFELGTVYTMIAGLLNILAIFDAGAGPAPILDDPKKTPATGDKPPPNEPDKAKEGDATPAVAGAPQPGEASAAKAGSAAGAAAKPGEKP